MKYRVCFVSNSSSSSFIISFDESAKETLISQNGAKVIYAVADFIREMRKKYETYGESTHVEAEGKESIYEYIKNAYGNYDKDFVDRVGEFLDKYPEQEKMLLQIEYTDSLMRRMLLNLIHMGLVNVLEDKYAMEELERNY